jgi:hypothetical protein
MKPIANVTGLLRMAVLPWPLSLAVAANAGDEGAHRDAPRDDHLLLLVSPADGVAYFHETQAATRLLAEKARTDAAALETLEHMDFVDRYLRCAEWLPDPHFADHRRQFQLGRARGMGAQR